MITEAKKNNLAAFKKYIEQDKNGKKICKKSGKQTEENSEKKTEKKTEEKTEEDTEKKSADDSQKEFYLREQLKFIQEELGEDFDESKELNELKEKINSSKMPITSLSV